MASDVHLRFFGRLFAALAYLLLLLTWIGLLVDLIGYFLMTDKYVKFHSGQAFLLGGVITIIELLFGAVIFFGPAVDTAYYYFLYAFYALTAIIYIGCAIAAFGGRDFRIPVVSKFLSK